MSASGSTPDEATRLVHDDAVATDKKTDEPQPLDEGALDPGGPVDIYAWKNIGYLAQYFSVGMIYGGIPATSYGLYIVYLNVPAYVAGAAGTIATFPWSFKVFFALLSDTVPIRGYRRIPYMTIGWSIAAVFLLALSALTLPPPYYCRKPDGTYDMHKVCNEEAKHFGMAYALLILFAACGYVLADVASDALTVTYGRREPAAVRGQTQTTAYLMRTCGTIVSGLIVGLGMNGKEYNGSFDYGLTFNQVCGVLAVPALLMVPVSVFLVDEPKMSITGGGCCACNSSSGEGAASKTGGDKGMDPAEEDGTAGTKGAGGDDEDGVVSLRAYFARCHHLLSSGALFEVLVFLYVSNIIGGIGTTAGAEIGRVWANVQNLQSQVFSILGHGLFVIGLWLVRKYFLHVSWRTMIVATTVFVNAVDVPFTYMTIYNVVRNQYFYLDDGLISQIPAAASFIVQTYVIVEMAEPGTEAITYGILTTASNLGMPVASALSNWISAFFSPSLSDSQNYVKDTPEFRNTVAVSCAIGYCFSFLALGLMPMLPRQKEDTQHRKLTRPRSRRFVYATIGILAVGLVYSTTVSFLSIWPSTSCLIIAGGSGC